ncbi:MAG TPA: hypothetical protein VFN30_07425 [Chitinophagaceae bacterium]|nr:hypothetical protein [Chitinophagaceae bacterium]
MKKQPWLYNAFSDGAFILSPPFLSLLIVFLFPSLFTNSAGMPEIWWVFLILLIDVAHVYSTLFRTYFDKSMQQERSQLLIIIPLLCFASGVLLYSVSYMVFWRCMAYIAVFHFVRQQYGFMRLYGRKEIQTKLFLWIDKITIYTATIYPIIFWHLSTPRNFNWFVDGDFYIFKSNLLLTVAGVCYGIILLVYACKEIYQVIKTKFINLPKNMVIIGTIVSWYFGIVYFNGDMAFTLLNVVSHGIPYMFLIWVYGKKNYANNTKGGTFLKKVFSKYGWLIFLGIIFILAYSEEGLWDLFVWNENRKIFDVINAASVNIDNRWLNIIVPLLAVPQLTHYVIDGFIWRISKKEVQVD